VYVSGREHPLRFNATCIHFVSAWLGLAAIALFHRSTKSCDNHSFPYSLHHDAIGEVLPKSESLNLHFLSSALKPNFTATSFRLEYGLLRDERSKPIARPLKERTRNRVPLDWPGRTTIYKFFGTPTAGSIQGQRGPQTGSVPGQARQLRRPPGAIRQSKMPTAMQKQPRIGGGLA
jgi:hypothetical protein